MQNTSNTTERLQGMIKETCSQVGQLETELNVKREILNTLREVMPTQEPKKRTQKNRGTSRIANIRGILAKANRPMHLNEILKTLNLKPNHNNKASVAGSLNNYAKRHKGFERTAPNTFSALAS